MRHQSLIKYISRLWSHFTKVRKKQLSQALVLMILAAFAEVVSLGAVIPFLSVLSAPDVVFAHSLSQPIISFLGIESPDQLVFPIVVLFVLAALLSGLIRLILLFITTRISVNVGTDIAVSAYNRTLYQNYSIHVERNSSKVINSIVTKSRAVVFLVLMPILNLVSSIIITFSILITLLLISPNIALMLFFGFGMIYWLIIIVTRKKLETNSVVIARESAATIKSLQEGLGDIRDILIDGSQEFYRKNYYKSDKPLRRAQGNNVFIAASPRYVLETFGMVLIATIAYTMSQEFGSLSLIIPTLGALAFGAQRLLPILQQGYNALSSIRGSLASLNDVLEMLEVDLPRQLSKKNHSPIIFNKKLELNNINFRYASSDHWILENLNLTLNKGERIGIIGETGSGKSTLIDVIIGLLPPDKGRIVIDNQTITGDNTRDWQKHIAHVPQNVFLADKSIEENIAIGMLKKEINHVQVRNAAQQAQISNLIESWPEKYQTLVGERGGKLSGGQRQRIGIARAIYKQAEVIIFDEVTSSLDRKTESAVMDAIENLDSNLTIIIITHNIITLEKCDSIYELKGGKLDKYYN
jgi:ATP-binding cassette, subfamily B, bacterial PglK